MSRPDESPEGEKPASAFDEAQSMNAPLQARLDRYRALRQPINPTVDALYDQLAARLVEAGAGAEAPEVGSTLPDFLLPDDQGRLTALDALVADGPLVLSLNRGHWCSFCRLELLDLAAIATEVEKRGARIVSITPERRRYAARIKRDNDLPFPVLSDIDNDYALSLGLMVWIGAELKAYFQERGLDLSLFQGNGGWFIPIPATFVIAPDRTVAARFVDPDFRRRMGGDAILSALDRL